MNPPRKAQKKSPASCDLLVRPARSPMMPTDPRMIPLMRKAHREFTVPCLTNVKTMRHAPNNYKGWIRNEVVE